MNRRILVPLFSLLSLLLLSFPAFGHGGGEAEIEIGADKGVLEVTSEKAFRLSPESKTTLKLQTMRVAFEKGGSGVSVPKNAIVHTLKDANLFRVRDGYYRAIPFRTLSKTERSVTVRSPDLQAGDEIVISGVGYLRMIAAQLGEVEDEHEEEKGVHSHD